MIPCPVQLDMTYITNQILTGAVGTSHQNKIYLPSTSKQGCWCGSFPSQIDSKRQART